MTKMEVLVKNLEGGNQRRILIKLATSYTLVHSM